MFALACSTLPFIAVEFVPSTDLPQHLAQVRLLTELWGYAPHTLDASALSARPFGAHTLVYWPLFALDVALGPRSAGRLTSLLVLLASVIALHELARRRGRDPVHALLGGVLLFSAPLYWGFLPFACGLPLFLLLLDRLLCEPAPEHPLRALSIDITITFLLAWAHVFWLPWAAVAIGLGCLRRRDMRCAIRGAAIFVPITLAISSWIPSLAQGHNWHGVGGSPQYTSSLLDRMSWPWIVRTLFGGLRGPTEPWTSAALGAYVVWVLIAARRARARESTVDRDLLLFGAVVAAFAWVAPDEYFNTLLVGGRFLPLAALCGLLALPPVSDRITKALAGAVVMCFSLMTTTSWAYYDQVDLAGLRESLSEVRSPRSVLGLNYRPRATAVYNDAFIQTFAYFQAEHGGELNFSFAEHQNGIVAYTKPRDLRWTPGLEWYPERLALHDLRVFDCALVNADEKTHAKFALLYGRPSRVKTGYFRIYCRK